MSTSIEHKVIYILYTSANKNFDVSLNTFLKSKYQPYPNGDHPDSISLALHPHVTVLWPGNWLLVH